MILRRRMLGGLAALLALSVAGPAAGANAGTGVALEKVGTFQSPNYVTSAPGFPHLLFVVERKGRIAVLRDGKILPRPFLDISRQVTTEPDKQGLIGLAFPPDYAESHRFYVQYADRAGDLRIEEYSRRTPTFAPPSSQRTLLTIPGVDGYFNHNGGQLQFRGRYLYSAVGDGADPGDVYNFAQNLESLRGKILRLDPRPSKGGMPFRVPRSNPFVGVPGLDLIYSYGLRNPFRFSFERVPHGPGRILIADVGQGRYEEINATTVAGARGANFGWDIFEGPWPYSAVWPPDAPCGDLCPNSGTPDPGGTVPPIKTLTHENFCAVIGGYVVRDPALPWLRGRYLYGDFCSGRIRSLVPVLTPPADDDSGIGAGLPSGPRGFPSLTSFGLDAENHIYVTSGNGPVYRLVPRDSNRGSAAQ